MTLGLAPTKMISVSRIVPRPENPQLEPSSCAVLNWLHSCAGVAELADARDSKSRALYGACGFDPLLRHHSLYSLHALAAAGCSAEVACAMNRILDESHTAQGTKKAHNNPWKCV